MPTVRMTCRLEVGRIHTCNVVKARPNGKTQSKLESGPQVHCRRLSVFLSVIDRITTR